MNRPTQHEHSPSNKLESATGKLFDAQPPARAERVRRKSNNAALNSVELDITPMIDCVFLLLIFFMVSSTMQGTPDLDVPFAIHTQGVDSRQSTVLILRPGRNPGDRALITLEDSGQPISFAEIGQRVTDAVRNGQRNVVVKAEGDVAHGDVRDAMQAAAKVQGTSVFAGVREK
ncbi:Biopolymer transport protein ExbD/TolR [Planctopirus ephydatiae]|uniref:Biopolymer transport protein ExbD/TolR n=1 Tax=Planctopirus ephydatiae TaxID=2528019 RepID=A0A518GPU3_9PLAN|nr:biopolymer transporter ExbD [Planctopirus ephydatiae]QDV30616.1 Biopolymer transport protein ExbD/TolR [Planctopirus ephydatiae]